MQFRAKGDEQKLGPEEIKAERAGIDLEMVDYENLEAKVVLEYESRMKNRVTPDLNPVQGGEI